MSITKTGIFNGNSLYEDNYSNILDGYTWTTGKYYNDSGTVTSSSNMKYITDYIPIMPTMSYKITITDSSTNRIRIHEYTNTQSWIRQAVSTTGKTSTWTTSATAAYIRICLPVNSTDIVLQRNITQPIAFIKNNQDIVSNQFYEY